MTTPKASEPKANRPPRSLRRWTTMPPRWVMAAVRALTSSSLDTFWWRSSTKGPRAMRYLPQAVTPKPRPNRPTPRVTASHWVWSLTQ